ncbi:hypothetical protein P280DRAFT_510217 [Massarina eburnea CBS 473.64]|uniref:Uncharacterized protein n=1 Tax=Massarina eburnea CBS 473.64 TaxID=1395130 RepID=A0A6A6RRR5_9PLEO|nr:hypothetical protein P280DRAFT_510217 [Massarina eburnea CBS 473.64]
MFGTFLFVIFILTLSFLECQRRNGADTPLARTLTLSTRLQRRPRIRKRDSHVERNTSSDDSQEDSSAPQRSGSGVSVKRVNFADDADESSTQHLCSLLDSEISEYRKLDSKGSKTRDKKPILDLSFKSSPSEGSDDVAGLKKPPTRGRRLGEKMMQINKIPHPSIPASPVLAEEKQAATAHDHGKESPQIKFDERGKNTRLGMPSSSTAGVPRSSTSASYYSQAPSQESNQPFNFGQPSSSYQSPWSTSFAVRNVNALRSNSDVGTAGWDFNMPGAYSPYSNIKRGGSGKNGKRDRKKGPTNTMRRAVARLSHRITKLNDTESESSYEEMEVEPTLPPPPTTSQQQPQFQYNHQPQFQYELPPFKFNPPLHPPPLHQQPTLPNISQMAPLFTFGNTQADNPFTPAIPPHHQPPTFPFKPDMQPTFTHTDRVPTPTSYPRTVYKSSLRRRLGNRVFGSQKSGPRFPAPPTTLFHSDAAGGFGSPGHGENTFMEGMESVTDADNASTSMDLDSHSGINPQFSFSRGSVASQMNGDGDGDVDMGGTVVHQVSFRKRSFWKGVLGRKRKGEKQGDGEGRKDGHVQMGVGQGVCYGDGDGGGAKRVKRG